MSLKININNKQEIVAGLEGQGSFSVIINYFNRSSEGKKVVMNITGIETNQNRRVTWLEAQELGIDDTVQIRVSDSQDLTKPCDHVMPTDSRQRKLEAYWQLQAELREEGLIE